MKQKIRSGVSFIDQSLGGGIPQGALTCLSTSDDRLGHLVLGYYLAQGLKYQEKVALITFDHAQTLMNNFKTGELNFDKYFQNGQLIVLNFQSNIRHKVNFLQNYEILFDEIKRLCDGHLPSRIAIHGADALVNFTNVQMAHVSAEKLGSACQSKLGDTSSVMAQFVNYPDKNHQHLAIALEKSSAASLYLNQSNSGGTEYEFCVRKAPWFTYDNHVYQISENDLLTALGVTSPQNGAPGVAA